MMFLPEDKWSPRYETQFYTIRMKEYTTLHSPPLVTDTDSMHPHPNPFGDNDHETDTCTFCSAFFLKKKEKKKKNYPAVYYEIEILRGTKTHKVLRRYSQFRELYKKFDNDPNNRIEGLKESLPPATHPFFRRVRSKSKSTSTSTSKSSKNNNNNTKTDNKNDENDDDDDDDDDAAFLKERMAGLYTFMKELLSTQQSLNNLLVEQFLELHDNSDLMESWKVYSEHGN